MKTPTFAIVDRKSGRFYSAPLCGGAEFVASKDATTFDTRDEADTEVVWIVQHTDCGDRALQVVEL